MFLTGELHKNTLSVLSKTIKISQKHRLFIIARDYKV